MYIINPIAVDNIIFANVATLLLAMQLTIDHEMVIANTINTYCMMKSYKLFPKCAILLKTSKSTANDISSKKTLSNKNERNDVVILFSDLIKSIRKKHIDIITSMASENLFRIIKVNIMLENIKNHAVLYIRSIKYLFWYKKRRNFSLQLNKNLNKLTCPLPT